MKNLVIMLTAVMLLAGAAGAVIVFEEDFTGAVGADITTLGWVNMNGTSWPITISDTVIDVGQSAQTPETGNNGPVSYIYDFADVTLETPLPGQYFQLTAAMRGMDGIASVYLHGKTRAASNGNMTARIEHQDIWHDPDQPGSETLKLQLPGNPYFDSGPVSTGTVDETVYVRLTATPGVNAGPDFGSTTLEYSATSASGPWTTVASTTLGGFFEVQSIEIGQGYGQDGPTWQQPMLDSIKLELLPEPATLVVLGIGSLAVLLKRRG